MLLRPTKLLLLVPLIIVLDFLIIGDIIKENKKTAVLGAKTIRQPANIKAVKTSAPYIDNEYIYRRWPTLTPSPTPSKAPTPTPIKTDILVYPSKNETSNSPTVNQSQTSVSVLSQETGLPLIDQINQFRASRGKSPVATSSETCSFATTRASEIANSFNHDGFRNRIDSKTLPYPSYSTVAENIAMNSDPNKVVPGWIESPGHAENMLKDVPYGCVGSSGKYYVYEAWKP